jgi:hypothetical protein
MIGIVGATVLLVSACGAGTGTFANKPTPPEPITITGQISNTRVLISPASFGAGPINLEITNAASQSVSLAVQNANGQSVARLQSINPQTPGMVRLDIAPGDYLVVASQPSIKPAELHVGSERSTTANSLLEP